MLQLQIVNKTKDFENILASQVGSEIAQEQLHADDDDDDGDDGDMLAHDDDSRLNWKSGRECEQQDEDDDDACS